MVLDLLFYCLWINISRQSCQFKSLLQFFGFLFSVKYFRFYTSFLSDLMTAYLSIVHYGEKQGLGFDKFCLI